MTARSLAVPAYGRSTLADLLPSVLAALDAPLAEASPRIPLPRSERLCLLLVDGLGVDLLAAADPTDAPFLHALLADDAVIGTCFPASTPISLTSLGTGRPPGEHGIVGFTMHVPPVAAVLEALGWTAYGGRHDLADRLPPERLQPHEPLFARATSAGLPATVVGLAEHERSGLSRAAFRGAAFDSFGRPEDDEARVGAVRRGLERAPSFVYTYDPRLDLAMHAWGIGSPEWRAALRATDALARRLAADAPSGTTLVVTGDHGGVGVAPGDRVDLGERPDLAAGVAWLSGDPRARHVHTLPGAADAVARAWSVGLGEGWHVLTRHEAIGSGLFGPRVAPDVVPRIGDVVAIAAGSGAICDRRAYPWELRLAGFHGALTPAETRVPLLVASR